MAEQIILAVDDQGNLTGQYIHKAVGHSGTGKRHLAITLLLFNNKDQVLLQKRKHQVFDNIWDLTGATHPLHKDSGEDESLIEAGQRCLKKEWRIKRVELKDLGSFNYFAKYDSLCENEHCHLLLGEYNGKLKLNPEVGYGYKWMKKQKFLKDTQQNPKKYSPWAIKGVKILKRMKFFE